MNYTLLPLFLNRYVIASDLLLSQLTKDLSICAPCSRDAELVQNVKDLYQRLYQASFQSQ